MADEPTTDRDVNDAPPPTDQGSTDNEANQASTSDAPKDEPSK